MVICTMFTFLFIQNSPVGSITSLFTVILSLIFFTTISIFTKAPPFRIVIPLIANIFFVMFILSDLPDRLVVHSSKGLFSYCRKLCRSKLIKFLSIIILFAVILFSAKNILAISALQRRQHIAFETLIKTLKTNPQLTYISWADGFPFEWMDAFQDMNVFDNLYIIELGDAAQSPIIKSMINRLGSSNLDLLMLENNTYVFISENLDERGYLFCTYINNHYGIQTRAILIKKIKTDGIGPYDNYNIVAFRPKTDADCSKFKSLISSQLN